MAQAKKTKKRPAKVTAKPHAHLTRQYIFLVALVALLVCLVMYVTRPDNPYNIQKPQQQAQPEFIDPSEEQ